MNVVITGGMLRGPGRRILRESTGIQHPRLGRDADLEKLDMGDRRAMNAAKRAGWLYRSTGIQRNEDAIEKIGGFCVSNVAVPVERARIALKA